jgi:branched-chain amino acid transport system permease protein
MIAHQHLGQRIINLIIQWSLPCLFFIYLLIYPVIATPFGTSNMILFMLFVPLNLGLCLLWGHCGVLSFGQVAFFGIAGYVYAIIAMNFPTVTGITIVGSLGALLAVSIVAGAFAYFLFYAEVSSWIFPVLTLALTLLLELFLGQTAGYEWHVGRVQLGGFNGINMISSLRVAGLDFGGKSLALYYLTASVCALLYLANVRLAGSRYGVIIRGVREDIQRTRMLGQNVDLIQVFVFAASALLAGFSGLLYIWWGNYIDPSSMGMLSATAPVISTVVGGKESFLAVTLSTIVLGYLGDYLSVKFAEYSFLLDGILLLTVMMFFPRGIFLTIGEEAQRLLSNLIEQREAILGTVGRRVQPINPCASVDHETSGERHAVLRLEKLSKVFGGIEAVTEVTLTVMAGEIHCLIGPNGAGKSTLFYLITGQHSADQGRIIFEGEPITHLRPYRRVRQGISLKFQTNRIYPSFSLNENLAIPYRIVANKPKQATLDLFGLTLYSTRLAIELSHAEKQWLEISLALATTPRLLLLDEPTVGMTAGDVSETARILKDLARGG